MKGKKCFATDCSGFIVGIWRKLGLIASTADATANGIMAGLCYKIAKADLKPADCVGFDGHIGLYIGAGYVAEAAGGNYAVTITKLNDRKLFNRVKGYTVSGTKWSKFGRPKKY
jgi:cell wall-associated NlpC family hydrolase